MILSCTLWTTSTYWDIYMMTIIRSLQWIIIIYIRKTKYFGKWNILENPFEIVLSLWTVPTQRVLSVFPWCCKRVYLEIGNIVGYSMYNNSTNVFKYDCQLPLVYLCKHKKRHEEDEHSLKEFFVSTFLCVQTQSDINE